MNTGVVIRKTLYRIDDYGGIMRRRKNNEDEIKGMLSFILLVYL